MSIFIHRSRLRSHHHSAKPCSAGALSQCSAFHGSAIASVTAAIFRMHSASVWTARQRKTQRRCPVRKKGDAGSTGDNIADAVDNLSQSGDEGRGYRWADARVMRCPCARLSSSATKTMPREAIEKSVGEALTARFWVDFTRIRFFSGGFSRVHTRLRRKSA